MTENRERAFWIGVLARAKASKLAQLRQDLEGPSDWHFLRAPELGLAMVQGRIGGDGSAFNLGEVTVTRCTLRRENGLTGFACIQGRNKQHAEDAAYLDALLQDPKWHDRIQESGIQPMHQEWQSKRRKEVADVESTQVDFFTMVRGENR